MPAPTPTFAERVVAAVFACVDRQKLNGNPHALARATLTPLLVAEVERVDAERGAAGEPAKAPTPARLIYDAYPRHVAPKAALRAIATALKGTPFADLLAKVQAYAAAVALWPAAERAKYVPHPATWFNRGSYADDPREWQRGAAAKPKPPENYDRI